MVVARTKARSRCPFSERAAPRKASFFPHDAPLFSEWQATKPERLQRVALEIFEALIQHLVARAELPKAIHYALRLLELEP